MSVLPADRGVTHATLEAAAATFLCQFGQPELEAHRRGRLRAVLRSSATLSAALDEFTRRATPHMRGEHSTQHMHEEVDALAHALDDWNGAMTAAAEAYRECRGELAPRAPRDVIARGPALSAPADLQVSP
jgi:hypothetical protein